jgi:hypothetical protein
MEEHFSGRKIDKSVNAFQQGGFAASAFTKHCEQAAGWQIKGKLFNPFKRGVARIIVGYVADGKDTVVLYKSGDKNSRKYRSKILILKIGCSK